MKKIPVRQIRSAPAGLRLVGQFSIRKLQNLLAAGDMLQPLHRHSFYFILLVESGNGFHVVDFVKHKVSDGSLFLLSPGQVHQLQLSANSNGFLLEFDSAFYYPTEKNAAQRFRKAKRKHCCMLNKQRMQKLASLLRNIYDESSEQQAGYEDAIRAGLDLFFIELIRQGTSVDEKTDTGELYAQDRFEEFTELLDRNILLHKHVSYYTGLMNLSSYQLNEITKKAVGKTASALIDDRIVLEAKRYLLSTNNQVKDIAWDLGYEDPSYFIRFFRKHTGHSPDGFRNKHL